MKKFLTFFLVAVSGFILIPFFNSNLALAQTNNSQTESGIAFPEIFPEENQGLEDFRVYIRNFYVFAIGAALLIATVLIMIGGFIWVTSAGNQQRVSQAQSYITQSVIGVVLLMSAYLILRLINPALVELKLPTFPEIGSLTACINSLGICEDGKDKLQCVNEGGIPIDDSCFERYQNIFKSAGELERAIQNLERDILTCNSLAQSAIDPEAPISQEQCNILCNDVDDECIGNIYNGNCWCSASIGMWTQLESLVERRRLAIKEKAVARCNNSGQGFVEVLEGNITNANNFCTQLCENKDCNFGQARDVSDINWAAEILDGATLNLLTTNSRAIQCLCDPRPIEEDPDFEKVVACIHLGSPNCADVIKGACPGTPNYLIGNSTSCNDLSPDFDEYFNYTPPTEEEIQLQQEIQNLLDQLN